MSATPPSLEIVIPVKTMERHLDACLSRITEQLGPADRVTVVDDGSTDASAEVALVHGANVLRLPESKGPYVARNTAGEQSGADALVFVDARSRPLPGWLDAHRRLLMRPNAALSCTNVGIVRGRSLASRIAHVQDSFNIATRVGVAGRWDWYPTANLGVRRDAFLAVEGFRPIRSGGDEDLCRRVQHGGHGVMAAEFETLMEWEPRDSIKQLARQWYRYGKGSVGLREPQAGARPEGTAAPGSTASSTARRLVRRAVDEPAEVPAVLGAFAIQLVFVAGQLNAALRKRR